MSATLRGTSSPANVYAVDGGIAARLNEVKDVPRRAVVHPGRPVTVGPAICQGCRSLVWWSGALWANQDGTWHRCSLITPLEMTGPAGTIGP